MVRTRFAPSPTGSLHIGGVRTALYSWALAKKHGGKFLLRIEDTDQERKIPGTIHFIITELQWLGLNFDEGPTTDELKAVGEPTEGLNLASITSSYGPFIQSLRKEIYSTYAEELIENGYAYRCDCTPDMLERERREQTLRREKPGYSGRCRYRNVPKDSPHAVRLKLPENFTVTADDAIRGKIRFENPPLRDPVLLKSDGFPTYHLAVVVDDHLMQISHVLRGEEWIATFPIHWYLYDLFGWSKPVFAHLPVILGEDGKKLSKRHGAVTTAELRDAGFLPQAILNSLCLVGWSHPEGKELFEISEFVEHFSLERVHASSGILSFPKMLKFNHEHIKALEPPEFLGYMKKILGANIPDFSSAYLKIIQERSHTLNDLRSLFCFLSPETTYELSQIQELEAYKVLKVVETFREALSSFDREALNKTIEELSKQVSWKKSEVFKVIRIATLKKLETPPLIDTILEFGKEWTEARLEEFEMFFNKHTCVRKLNNQN